MEYEDRKSAELSKAAHEHIEKVKKELREKKIPPRWVKHCEHCNLKWWTGDKILHAKHCVWYPCNGEVVTATKRYSYYDEMEGLAGRVILGELTYEEAEKVCYDRYWLEDISCSRLMLDVTAELHGLVRKHARALVPVYFEHVNGVIDKIFELTDARDATNAAKVDRINDLLRQLEEAGDDESFHWMTIIRRSLDGHDE